MTMKLLLSISQSMSISLIKKYKHGLPNRLQDFDDWVATWKDPHIHTYYDYYLNGQLQKHQFYMPNCEKAKAALSAAEFNFRPGIADISRRYQIAEQNFADDLQLAEDIQKITLKSFFTGFTSAETRTDLQRLAFWLPLGLMALMICFYFAVYLGDDEQDVVQLEPHKSYFHYQAPLIKQKIAGQIEKIHFLDRHSRDVLKEAKERALLRANSPK